jgi:hypothetical protein
LIATIYVSDKNRGIKNEKLLDADIVITKVNTTINLMLINLENRGLFHILK